MSESCCFSIADLPCLADHQLEGTPFVPMAVLIDQLARTLNATNALAEIEIKMPVMLRKSRAKTLFCHKHGRNASLLDGSGNVYATLEGITNISTDSPAALPQHLPASAFNLDREQIYPALMFHGPTFQADFKFYEFNAQTALVELSGFDTESASLGRCRYGQQIPVVITDLALQIIGLHLMAFSGIYALPATCANMTRHDLRPIERALVRISAHNDGSYDLVATTIAGTPVLTCRNLRFQNTARSVEPEKKQLLESIKT